MTGGGPGGPRWVEWMLGRLESPALLRELTSELEELYAHRRKRDGEASARRADAGVRGTRSVGERVRWAEGAALIES